MPYKAVVCNVRRELWVSPAGFTATYSNVGRIGDDQAQDWAARTQIDIAAARRQLAASL